MGCDEIGIDIVLNRRIRTKTLFRFPWRHKNEDAGSQQGLNPNVETVFGIALTAPVVVHGSVYHCSARYKNLIQGPEVCYLT